jgi:hypothetical protein
MPELQFESLTDSLSRLPGVIASIPDILREPAANPLQAAILLAIALLFVLIVLMTVILAIMGRSAEDDEFAYAEYGDGSEEQAIDDGALTQAPPMSPITVASIIVLVFALVWVVAGVTTGSPGVCTSCHGNSRHTAAGSEDPHQYVNCVNCHETGGSVARATVNLPVRVEHVISARLESENAKSYGRPVASDGCIRCHSAQIQGVTTNKSRGLRMSHEQPLAAGAQCVSCHILKSGVVGQTTAGMTPCLRCHNETITSSDCAVCHIGDPGNAIRSEITTDAMASVQVPNPQCDGCHFDMTSCNKCHGIEMPHSIEFKAYSHARDGALDIWYNDGKMCANCHYAGHNNCVQSGCHVSNVAGGHPNPDWAKLHQHASWKDGGKTACSCHQWNAYDHAGMIYCQICHPVKPRNAVP